MSLAELADVEARLGRTLSGEELRRIDALLDDASAVVKAYTRRSFVRATTTDRLRPRGHKVVLAQRPVISVDSVAHVIGLGPQQIVTPTSAYSWPGGNEIRLLDPSYVINGPSFAWDEEDYLVEVTYTHGFAEVPGPVKAVTANLVIRVLSTPAGGYVDMQQIGPYTTRYSSFSTAGPLALSDADRRVLNRYRLGHRTIELGA